MLKRILLILAAGCLSLQAADTPPSEASVKELLTLTQVSKLMDSMSPQIDAMMQNGVREALKGQTLTPETQAKFDRNRSEALSSLKDELSWSKLEPIYLRTYQKTFTQDEINGMIAFYKTPTGQAMINKMPGTLQTTMTEIQSAMAPTMQKLQRMQQEFLQQVMAESKPK